MYYLQYAEHLSSPWERISPAFSGSFIDRNPGRVGRKRGFYRLELRQPGMARFVIPGIVPDPGLERVLFPGVIPRRVGILGDQ